MKIYSPGTEKGISSCEFSPEMSKYREHKTTVIIMIKNKYIDLYTGGTDACPVDTL